MTTRTALGFLSMVCLLSLTANAGGKGEFQRYFRDAASRVKATEVPSEKRKILNESVETMVNALGMVQTSTSVSKQDGEGIDLLKAMLQEKQSELAGSDGYTRVPDVQLNAFSDYIVQDMEQADQYVTISLISLVLIIILVVLLVR